METIGENYSIDVALLNIGGHTAMEPRMAAKAAQSFRAKLAIPDHFGTFPGITPNAGGLCCRTTENENQFSRNETWRHYRVSR